MMASAKVIRLFEEIRFYLVATINKLQYSVLLNFLLQ